MGFMLARWTYSLLLTLLLPFLFIRFYWRGRKTPAYRDRWLERLGIFQKPVQQMDVWIHAVSVGEAMAATCFVQKLLSVSPYLHIVVTTTTPTGSLRVQSVLGDKVFHVYLPFDIPFLLNGFFSRTAPGIAIIMETEIWPNLLYGCKKRKIPVLLANARLSSRSMDQYRKLGRITSYMLSLFDQVLVQGSSDQQHFEKLGLMPSAITIMGNLKFDMEISKEKQDKGSALKAKWQRPVLIAASTHSGEEKMILAAFLQIKQVCSNMLLILVPRHPERSNEITSYIQQTALQFVQRSAMAECKEDKDIYLIDTLGELDIFYSAADIAFVGGSLVNVGGHNMLEAAAQRLPIITGPYLHNFLEISENLLKCQGMVTVKTPEMLANVVLDWLHHPNARQQIGDNAYQFFKKNQGASDMLLSVVQKYISPMELKRPTLTSTI